MRATLEQAREWLAGRLAASGTMSYAGAVLIALISMALIGIQMTSLRWRRAT